MQTMTLTIKSIDKPRTARRIKERIMFGISLKDHIRSTDIRNMTREGLIEPVAASKWRWTGYVLRQNEEKWAKRVE